MQIPVPLNEVEIFILKDLFESNLPSSYYVHFDTNSVVQDCTEGGFTQERTEEALECLVDRGYVKGEAGGDNLPPYLRFSETGFAECCEMFISDYDDAQKSVAVHLTQLSDEESAQVSTIAQALGKPFLVTYHFVDFFARLGWVGIHREHDEYAFIHRVSPLLKRSLEG